MRFRRNQLSLTVCGKKSIVMSFNQYEGLLAEWQGEVVTMVVYEVEMPSSQLQLDTGTSEYEQCNAILVVLRLYLWPGIGQGTDDSLVAAWVWFSSQNHILCSEVKTCFIQHLFGSCASIVGNNGLVGRSMPTPF